MHWFICLSFLGAAIGRVSHHGRQDEELFSVIVGMKTANRPKLLSRIAQRIRPGKVFHHINAMSLEVTRSELETLQQDPDVEYVEEDAFVYPDAEALLYGQEMIQAQSPVLESQNFTVPATAACNDPDSFKIGIIDSGLDVNHPDIPCLPIDDEKTNCIGAEFGLESGDGVWHNPKKKYHGTHVAGVIGARGDNGVGIKGIIPDGNFCFLIGRVFGESGAGSKISSIFDAVEWMVEKGVHVINMSLGTGTYNSGGNPLMKSAYSEGVLLIAASGNGGDDSDHYPANYENVLSVAAVNEAREWADFSQYNSGVDLTAPGVDVLSTFPSGSSEATLITYGANSVVGRFMKHSELVKNITGTLVGCPDYGQSLCPGDGGHVCLIERGKIKFEEKALNCEAGGGVAAIIFNNEPGNIGGGLATPTKATIPVLEIRTIGAQSFLRQGTGSIVRAEVKAGYGYSSGTSMAVPHVVGVASKIWRDCPQCSNQDVESCLINSTVDLGPVGKDTKYGWGLIQAEAAFLCLRSTVKCCGNGSLSKAIETMDESLPTLSLETSTRPTQVPSSSPSIESHDADEMRHLRSLISSGGLSGELLELLDENIVFECSFTPLSESLLPMFRPRHGITEFLERQNFILQNTTIISDDRVDGAIGDGVAYFTQKHNSSILIGGPSAEWESLTKIQMRGGKVYRVVFAVADGQSINKAYN